MWRFYQSLDLQSFREALGVLQRQVDVNHELLFIRFLS